MNWLVEFAGCSEAVIRTGSREEVSVPDELGCPVERVRPLEEVRVRAAWTKGGEMRVEVEDVGDITTDGRPRPGMSVIPVTTNGKPKALARDSQTENCAAKLR